MFLVLSSSCWIWLGLYPSVVVSEVFLSMRRVMMFMGFQPLVMSVVCVLAYMGSFVNVMRG